MDGEAATAARTILESIRGKVDEAGPQLILIEAAAGFGKTCTAYEVLASFIRDSPAKTPIFTELSRNRQARVFRYVLLDEIDRNYPGLNSALVQHEIRSGRLPLIIDGFDELLSKRAALPDARANVDVDFGVVENMLDTIGDLLRSSAKIILTTRRTAIFSGREFDHWLERRSEHFTLTRLAIQEPNLTDWLGTERARQVAKCSVPIRQISNPVLLTFLRSLDEDGFNACCGAGDILIDRYFTSLLDREQKRQDLRIDTPTQTLIFRRLARQLATYDVVAEDRAFIASLILMDSQEFLDAARSTYAPSERPTLEDLADKLSTHALLDRSSTTEDTVGFVNEFVFGTLIGDDVLEHEGEEWVRSERMFSLAVTAYRARSPGRRFSLWKKLEFCSRLLDPTSQFLFDIDLAGALMRAVAGITFDAVLVAGGDLASNGHVSQCTFINCTFKSVTFDMSRLTEVGFLNCVFDDCRASGSPDLPGFFGPVDPREQPLRSGFVSSPASL